MYTQGNVDTDFMKQIQADAIDFNILDFDVCNNYIIFLTKKISNFQNIYLISNMKILGLIPI